LTASLDRISQANEQIATQTADRARREAESLEVESLQRAFALEDEQAEQAQHWQTIANIAADGRKRIEAIQGDLSKLATERTAKISEIQSKGDSRVQKIQSEYMQKALADAKLFAKESERIEADGNKAQLRLIRSITDRLESAEASNSILDFLTAEKEGRQQLSDAAVDANDAEKRRIEDYNAKQAEAAALQQQRVNEAIDAINAEKLAALQSYEERRQSLVASIETERQAIVDKTNAAITAEDAQQAKEQQTADRQAQLAAVRDKHEEDAFQRTITAIEQRRNAELAVYTELQNRITTIGAAIRTNLQMQTNNQQIASGQQNRSSNLSSGSTLSGGIGFGSKIKVGTGFGAFAKGGLITEPTIALIGERGPEMVLPFKSSPGLPPAFNRGGMGMGGNNISVAPQITVHLSVGDIASASMVRQEVQAGVEAVLYDGIAPLILNALSGRTA